MNSNKIYCGTWSNGLWKTDDNGQTWEKTLLTISNVNITIVSVSPIEKGEEEKQDKTIYNLYPERWQKAQVLAEFGLALQVISHMKITISVKQMTVCRG